MPVDALRVRAAVEVLEGDQLGLELAEELGAVLALPLLLLRVVADHVPAAPFAVADDDILGIEVFYN